MWNEVKAAVQFARTRNSKDGMTLIKVIINDLEPAEVLELKAIVAAMDATASTVVKDATLVAADVHVVDTTVTTLLTPGVVAPAPVVQPTVVQPTVVQPTVVQPTVVQPTVVQPTGVPTPVGPAVS